MLETWGLPDAFKFTLWHTVVLTIIWKWYSQNIYVQSFHSEETEPLNVGVNSVRFWSGQKFHSSNVFLLCRFPASVRSSFISRPKRFRLQDKVCFKVSFKSWFPSYYKTKLMNMRKYFVFFFIFHGRFELFRYTVFDSLGYKEIV